MLEEFLKPLGISQTELADRIQVSYPRINELVHGKRGVTPDTAVIGVSLDSASITRTYVREHALPFPVALLDDPGAAAMYRIPGVPLTMVIDDLGRIRLVRPGRFTRTAGDSLATFLSIERTRGDGVARR